MRGRDSVGWAGSRQARRGAISGRESSLSKDLRRHFRATWSPPRIEDGRQRTCGSTGPAGLISGRGSNVFKPLRRHFRADSQWPVHRPEGQVAEHERVVEVAGSQLSRSRSTRLSRRDMAFALPSATPPAARRNARSRRTASARGSGAPFRARPPRSASAFRATGPLRCPYGRALPQAGDDALEAQRGDGGRERRGTGRQSDHPVSFLIENKCSTKSAFRQEFSRLEMTEGCRRISTSGEAGEWLNELCGATKQRNRVQVTVIHSAA